MAQRMEVQFIDDIDGSPADATVNFAIDSSPYEIDLSAAHAEEFRSALQPYLAAARKVSGATRRASKTARSTRPSPSAVREWAKSEGIKVSNRGRVPGELVVKFQEANI
jgi:hypothetical protein